MSNFKKNLYFITFRLRDILALIRLREVFIFPIHLSLFLYTIGSVSFAQNVDLLPQNNKTNQILIEADNQSTDRNGEVFLAYGNVKITYLNKGIIATSSEAKYLKNEGLVVLTGNVDLKRMDGNSILGDRIVYSLKDDRIFAESNSDSQVLLKLLLEASNQPERSVAK